MAKLPPIRLIRLEDLQGADASVKKLVAILNPFVENVYRAINRGLTFQENIAASIQTLTFRTSSTYEASDTFEPIVFETTFNQRPAGVMLLQLFKTESPEAVLKEASTITDWRELSTGQVSIRFISGLEDSTRYTARVLVV